MTARADRAGLALVILAPIVIALVLAAFMAGYNLGDKHGEARAVSELRPEIDRLQAELVVAAERIMLLNDRLARITEAYTTTGLASFYAYPFHGRPTASGEIFDKDKLTAASRWLRLKTWWTVTRLDNGKSVRVWVNDRGPYVGNRIIDLSEAAARALGMIERGVVRVRVEPE